jgi:acyl-CoA reductase-like NAD-dependent aldehyde dehydrogenase
VNRAASAELRLRRFEPSIDPSSDPPLANVQSRRVALQAYSSVDEALRLANATRCGLQAAIFTADLGLAPRAARELDFGGVLVNEVPTYRTDQMPYGGVRDSGNTREGPSDAVHEMTESRLVILQA